MAYQIFEKSDIRSTDPTITFGKIGRISLNAAATRIFHANAVEWVLLLFDKDTLKIALRPITKKDSRAAKITYTKGAKSCSFSAKTFLEFCKIDCSKNHRLPVVWNERDGLLEVSVPVDAFKDDKQRRLALSVEPGKRSTKVG